MAVTAQEVLQLFTNGGSVNVGNSDLFLMAMVQPNGEILTKKITAEVVRAYLNAGYALTVDADGYLCIGGERTTSRAAGITPQLERGQNGIYVSEDNGATWRLLAYFSDFSAISVVAQTGATANISPNVLNVWGEAMDAITVTFVSGASGVENEYKMRFIAGEDFVLTLPNGVRWASGEEPEWEEGWTYEVSVLDGLALYAGWEPQS